MIALDTNVLIRLFIDDDSMQPQKARALFDTHKDLDDSLWIADIVMLELAWTLDRRYDLPRPDICAALKALAGNACVLLESGSAIEQSIALYEKGPAGFADCLLAVKASMARCDALRTFDKKMRALPNVKLI